MVTTLVTVGIACLIASIVGGQLKAFGIDVPLITSQDRQFLLATLGILLLAVALIGRYYSSVAGIYSSLQNADYMSVAWLWSPIAGWVQGVAIGRVFFAIKERELNWRAVTVLFFCFFFGWFLLTLEFRILGYLELLAGLVVGIWFYAEEIAS